MSWDVTDLNVDLEALYVEYVCDVINPTHTSEQNTAELVRQPLSQGSLDPSLHPPSSLSLHIVKISAYFLLCAKKKLGNGDWERS